MLIVKELLIPGIYLVLVILFKKHWLDKKYDAKKSLIVSDCLNAVVIVYFLVIQDLLMTLVFVFLMMTKYNSYKPRKKTKKK
jgi:hypothetical protein